MKVHAVAVLCVGLAVGAPASAGHSQRISGSAVQAGCVPTTYEVATGRFRCEGLAVVEGSWLGRISFVATGRGQLGTGNVSGKITEVFDGTSGGRQGTITMSGTFTINGTTGIAIARLEIRRGTGDFRRSSGTVTVRLSDLLSMGFAHGSYSGRWTHPAYG